MWVSSRPGAGCAQMQVQTNMDHVSSPGGKTPEFGATPFSPVTAHTPSAPLRRCNARKAKRALRDGAACRSLGVTHLRESVGSLATRFGQHLAPPQHWRDATHRKNEVPALLSAQPTADTYLPC